MGDWLGFWIIPSEAPDVLCKSLSPFSSASCAGGCQEQELRLNGDRSSIDGSISCLPLDNSPRLNTECISVNICLPMHSKDLPTHTQMLDPTNTGVAAGRQRQEPLFLQLLWGLAGITCAWGGAELILSSEQQCSLC